MSDEPRKKDEVHAECNHKSCRMQKFYALAKLLFDDPKEAALACTAVAAIANGGKPPKPLEIAKYMVELMSEDAEAEEKAAVRPSAEGTIKDSNITVEELERMFKSSGPTTQH